MDDLDLRRELIELLHKYDVLTGAFYLNNLNVYHYTSSEGLKGIIEGKNLFFSDSDFLSDRNERSHFYEVFSNLIDEINKELPPAFLEHLNDVLKYCNSDDFYQENPQRDRFRFFVFSCSMNDDNLLLWNNYTKNQQKLGYNISFEVNGLANVLISGNRGLKPLVIEPETATVSAGKMAIFPMYGSIIYKDDLKKSILKEILIEYLELWKRVGNNENQLSYCIRQLGIQFSKLSLFFKNSKYEGEEEFRFVFVTKNSLLDARVESGESIYDFRMVHGIPVPYIKISFEHSIGIFMGAKVSFGTKDNCDIAVQGASHLLYSNGFWPKVTRSTIPLRY